MVVTEKIVRHHFAQGQHPSSNARRNPTMSSTHARERILLVEDDRDTLDILGEVFAERGYVVRKASSVAEALDEAAHDGFDLVISDIGLPDGSGIDLMRQLRAQCAKTKGVALTGFDAEDDVDRARAAGFAAHLTKPIGVNQLIALVERLMNH
jgi:CheY-like chemotaxis protein